MYFTMLPSYDVLEKFHSIQNYVCWWRTFSPQKDFFTKIKVNGIFVIKYRV